MKLLGCKVVVVIFGTILCTSCWAQEIFTTSDGRRGELNPDGTWHYLTNSPAAVPASAIETARAYFSAPSWRDRLPYVLNPEKVKPLMETRYAGKAWKTSQFTVLTKTEPIPSRTGWVKIDVDVTGRTMECYLKRTKVGYRIDWETSVGFNPVSPAEFSARRPTQPVRFRIWATLDDYYNYQFHDGRDVYYSIAITAAGGDNIGHGYARRNTTTGKSLFEALKDGRKRQMVVDIKYPPDSDSDNGSVFLIVSVLNLNGWWYEITEDSVQQ